MTNRRKAVEMWCDVMCCDLFFFCIAMHIVLQIFSLSLSSFLHVRYLPSFSAFVPDSDFLLIYFWWKWTYSIHIRSIDRSTLENKKETNLWIWMKNSELCLGFRLVVRRRAMRCNDEVDVHVLLRVSIYSVGSRERQVSFLFRVSSFIHSFVRSFDIETIDRVYLFGLVHLLKFRRTNCFSSFFHFRSTKSREENYEQYRRNSDPPPGRSRSEGYAVALRWNTGRQHLFDHARR